MSKNSRKQLYEVKNQDFISLYPSYRLIRTGNLNQNLLKVLKDKSTMDKNIWNLSGGSLLG